MQEHEHAFQYPLLDNRSNGGVRMSGTGSFTSGSVSKTEKTGGGNSQNLQPYAVINVLVKY